MTPPATVSASRTASLETALAHAARLLRSSPDLALQQADEILAAVPQSPAASLLRAQALRLLGRHHEALTQVSAAATTHPRWPNVWLELATVLAAVGRGGEAIPALRRALALDPGSAQAWLMLSEHLTAIGDDRAAAGAYQQHLRHAARDPQLLQAADALAGNRLPEAETVLRERLKRQPTDAPAIRMLAEVAARLGRNEDALQLLQRCLELAPGFAAARMNYATMLHRCNEPLRSLQQIDAILAQESKHPGARNLKAVVFCRTGDYQPAIAIYDELLREYPGQARIWMSLGHALKTDGQGERAIIAYRRCIELDAGSGEAWWSLANLKTFRFEAGDVAAMQAQLQRDDLDGEQRAQFEFALGKAREDERDFSASFAHYAQGNALRRSQVGYRADDTAQRVQRSRQLFTPEFFARTSGLGCQARDPIFVVGLPRAGSTLVEQILSSHPIVEGTMELPEMISITGELRREAGDGGTYHDALATLAGPQWRALGERYLQNTRIQRKTAAPFFIDKMPNNFLHVGLIHGMLPNARIIDVRRHPMACCFSGFKQYFARGQNFTYSLEDIGRYYRDYVALMQHFDEVLPGRVHRVIYEQLIDDTEGEVRRLLDYCGLAFDPQCLRFFENKRAVRTASSEQVRRPIYREGLEHWRHYEPWLQPLQSALGTVLEHYPEVPPEFRPELRPS